MDNKPHQRLLDGMPPHIADKVDKMIGNMKEVYDLTMESWEGCDGCTEQDKHFFINGFMRGYNMGKPDKIKVTVKKDSPAADIIKAAKEEKQAFKEAVELELMEYLLKLLNEERDRVSDRPAMSLESTLYASVLSEETLKSTEEYAQLTRRILEVKRRLKEIKSCIIDRKDMEKNKQQTATTWLINELIQNRLVALRYDSDDTFGEIIEKAKQMEKEQLNIARLDGINLANKGYGK